jgi:hypothetical protein
MLLALALSMDDGDDAVDSDSSPGVKTNDEVSSPTEDALLLALSQAMDDHEEGRVDVATVRAALGRLSALSVFL